MATSNATKEEIIQDIANVELVNEEQFGTSAICAYYY
jgi:hypothetical protein